MADAGNKLRLCLVGALRFFFRGNENGNITLFQFVLAFQLLPFGFPLLAQAQQFGLPLDLLTLFVQIDKDSHLGLQNIFVNRLWQIVDGSRLIAFENILADSC